SPPVLALLAIFKEQPTMAGGLLRLSATFAYANIAAMYYEAVLPICLAAVGLIANRLARRLLSGAALLLYCATLLTYSRAALLTPVAATMLMLLGAMRFKRNGPNTNWTSVKYYRQGRQEHKDEIIYHIPRPFAPLALLAVDFFDRCSSMRPRAA